MAVPPPQEIAPGIVLSYGQLNRIPNSSVEQGADWPDDWFHSVSGAEWSTTARTGFKSLLLNVSDSIADWRSQAFQVLPNEAYTLQAWIQGNAESGEFFITVRWWRDLAATDFISEDNIPIPLGTYQDWTLMENEFKAPLEAVAADVLFRCPTPSTGKVYADDLALLTIPFPQYRITVEAIEYPFNVTLNPVEVYSNATVYFLEAIQFYPLTVELTVKAADTATIEVFDADHERFLLPTTQFSGTKKFTVKWDGGGVFEPRTVGAIESIVIDFPVEKPKTVQPVEYGKTTLNWKDILAFLIGLVGGGATAYTAGRKK